MIVGSAATRSDWYGLSVGICNTGVPPPGKKFAFPKQYPSRTVAMNPFSITRSPVNVSTQFGNTCTQYGFVAAGFPFTYAPDHTSMPTPLPTPDVVNCPACNDW